MQRSQKKEEGESRAVLQMGVVVVRNITLLSFPPSHALLQPLLVFYSTSIRLPLGFGISIDISCVNAVIIRAVKMGGGEMYFKNSCQNKSLILFFNSRLDLVVIVFETIFHSTFKVFVK